VVLPLLPLVGRLPPKLRDDGEALTLTLGGLTLALALEGGGPPPFSPGEEGCVEIMWLL